MKYPGPLSLQRAVVGAIVGAIALCGTACNQKNKRQFVYCSEGAPSTFNPQFAGDGTTFDASSQPMYNRLLQFKEGTSFLEPSLAKSWAVSNGGKEIIFELRKDVSFHQTKYFEPSRKLNADDVIFTFLKMMDQNHPYHVSKGKTYEYFESMGMRELLVSVKKVSDHKVKFFLKRPEAPFFSNLAMDFASILSKEYADKLLKEEKKEQINTHPVGTGPFKFLSYDKNKKIKYKSHKDYFLGESKITDLTFLIMPNPSKRLRNLKKGKCHFIKDLASFTASGLGEGLGGKEEVKFVKALGLNVGYIGINLNLKKFQNKKLRHALSKALDRSSYIDAVYSGNAVQAKSPIPPGNWAYNKKLKGLDYDLEEAKRLIKESGVDLPLQVNLWTLPVSRPYNPNGKIMGELIKEDLRQIGVDVKLVTYDWPTYLKKLKLGDHELVQYGWSADNGDPDNFLHILLSCSGAKGGSNVSRFCDKTYDEYVTQAKRVFSKKKRISLYHKALERFQEEMPLLPIAHSNLFRMMRKDVRGYKVGPMGTDSFYKVKLNSWK